jgi:hypothetical protein
LHLSMVRTSPSFVIKKTQVEDSQLWVAKNSLVYAKSIKFLPIKSFEW